MNDKPQHIVALTVANVKRVVAFKAVLSPTGLTILSGENAAGKSSVLDAIEMALSGRVEPKPIHAGAAKGHVVVETEELIVTRRYTPNNANGYLDVATKDGTSQKSPQKMLDTMLSTIGFDPLAFSMMKEREQAEELLRICPVELDLAKNALDTKTVYDERTAANREVKRIEAHLASLPKPMENPPAPVRVTTLVNEKNARLEAHMVRTRKLNTELEALREQDKGHQEIRQSLLTAHSIQSGIMVSQTKNQAWVVELRQKLEKAEAEELALTQDLEESERNIEKLTAKVSAIPDLVPQATEIKKKLSEACDTADIDAKITAAESTNKLAQEAQEARKAIEEATDSLVDARKDAEHLDTEHGELVESRRIALQQAKFPVEGLSLGDDGTVILGGIPLQQASTAQKIKLGIHLAIKANPQLRVCFVRDGSLLDANNMKLLADLAKENDIQIWVERVENDPGSIQIVDGHGGNQSTTGEQ